MSQGRRMKDKAMAAMLKDKGVRRTTGQCPMCHSHSYSLYRPISLISHLGRCKGSPRKITR
jgi:hypothetical protein